MINISDAMIENNALMMQQFLANLVTNIRYEYVASLPENMKREDKAERVLALDKSIGRVIRMKTSEFLPE